jgi:hypothetical protein
MDRDSSSSPRLFLFGSSFLELKAGECSRCCMQRPSSYGFHPILKNRKNLGSSHNVYTSMDIV